MQECKLCLHAQAKLALLLNLMAVTQSLLIVAIATLVMPLLFMALFLLDKSYYDLPPF